jgi:hypothetical protein
MSAHGSIRLFFAASATRQPTIASAGSGTLDAFWKLWLRPAANWLRSPILMPPLEVRLKSHGTDKTFLA